MTEKKCALESGRFDNRPRCLITESGQCAYWHNQSNCNKYIEEEQKETGCGEKHDT